MVSTGGGAFQLEDTTFCGGGVRFDLEEGVILSLDKGYILISRGLLPPLEWSKLVSVAALQQQSPHHSFNCGPLCIAAAYHAAKGDYLAEMTFDENKLCQHLVNCFECQELTPFPLAPPKETVCRAQQQNILIEIH